MVLNTVNSYSVRRTSVCCILTCIYLPTIMLILYYTDYIYRIGKFQLIPLILIFMFFEYIKFSFSFFMTDISFGTKNLRTVKLKKFYSKLKLKEIFNCVCVMSLVFFVFYLLAILFGAPVLSECEETFMFASLLSALIVFPSYLNLGSPDTIALLTGSKPLINNAVCDLVLRNGQLTVLGAWLGAIVIPLDWDRPWQLWPIPCCLGAILGSIVAHIVTPFFNMSNIVKLFTNKSNRNH